MNSYKKYRGVGPLRSLQTQDLVCIFHRERRIKASSSVEISLSLGVSTHLIPWLQARTQTPAQDDTARPQYLSNSNEVGNLTALLTAASINDLNALPSSELDAIEQARDWVASARSVAVLTGAGISAESGVPTFRGAGGLWRNFRPEELATPSAFARDPKLVWEWYDWRRSVIAQAEPNPGHLALAELERRKPHFWLITQNVDGLHERAGSRRVTKLHGDIWELRCLGCGREERNARVPLETLPPRCACGGLMRPAVVWFGEALPAEALETAFDAARRAEVFLVLGTSSVVYPAASLPQVALEHGARVIEINLEPTELSRLAHISLRGKTGELLPQIMGQTR
jgi:NAD-dependent protein deacetylase/lipoamidase